MSLADSEALSLSHPVAERVRETGLQIAERVVHKLEDGLFSPYAINPGLPRIITEPLRCPKRQSSKCSTSKPHKNGIRITYKHQLAQSGASTLSKGLTKKYRKAIRDTCAGSPVYSA